MRSNLFIITALTLSLTSCTSRNQADRPNIIIILADDMGYSDIGFFSSEINTPNIDRLASGGLVMTNFYNSGRCCTSRASLLTGLYQHEAGVGYMNGDLGVPSYQGFLNENCVTIAEVLQEAGYHTLFSGKWHVGNEPGQWPMDRGFERSYGFPKGGGVYYYPWREGRDLVLNDSVIQADSSFYSTDNFTDYAIQFVEDVGESENPFFLYLAYMAPHFPLQAHPEDIASYIGSYGDGFQIVRGKRYQQLLSRSILPDFSDLSAPDSMVLDWGSLSTEEKTEYDLRMAVYAAQVECMDRNIGRLVSTLRERGKYENTIIFFLSDNGASNEGPLSGDTHSSEPIGARSSWTSYRASWANVSNTPFRLYKHWVHEGGISTPLVISHPAVIKDHRIETQTGHIIDLMPTCCDLAGVEYPEKFHEKEILSSPGLSLMPVINGETRRSHDFLFWEHMGNKAVRMQKWKLVMKHSRQQWELYDIEADRAEMNDLSTRHPDLVEYLAEKYAAWEENSGVEPWDSIIQVWPVQ